MKTQKIRRLKQLDDWRPDDRWEREHQITIWELRRLLHDALDTGLQQDLLKALRNLSERGDELRRAIIAWTALVDLVVHALEEEYGTAPGRGGLKLNEAKSVIRYLLRAERIDIPTVPRWLEPVFVDMFAEITVGAVVRILNKNGLWQVDGRRRPPPRSIASFLRRLLAPLFLPLLRFGAWVWSLVSDPITLSPAVRAAIDEVERQGVLGDLDEILTEIVGAKIWMARNIDKLLPWFDLVVAVIKRAERFASLSGPEKKEYATGLIWAVLEDYGFSPSGLGFAIVNMIIEAAIEIAVTVFNRREGF